MGMIADQLRQRFGLDIKPVVGPLVRKLPEIVAPPVIRPIVSTAAKVFPKPEAKPAPAAPAAPAPASKPTPIADSLRERFFGQTPSQPTKTPVADALRAKFGLGGADGGIRSVDDFKSRISGVESGGKYGALGPVISSGMYKGDRAYGKYQVMGNNIPSWSKQYLGVALTPQQFLANPELQEKMMTNRFNDLYRKYGNWRDVQSVHFTGRPYNRAGGQVADQLGTTNDQYWAKMSGGNTAIIPKAMGAERPLPVPVAKKEEKKGGFLRTLFDKAQEIGSNVNEAATRFVDEQKSVIADFGKGKYTVSAADVAEGMKDTLVGGAKLTGIMAQGFNEGVLKIGKTIASASLPGYAEQTADQGDPLTKALTGKERVRTYQELHRDSQQWAVENGATPAEASIFSGMAVLGALMIDSPIGGPGKAGFQLSKNAISKISTETSEEVIRAIIKAENPKISDEIAAYIAPAMSASKTPEEVATLVSMVNNAGVKASAFNPPEPDARPFGDETEQAVRDFRELQDGFLDEGELDEVLDERTDDYLERYGFTAEASDLQNDIRISINRNAVGDIKEAQKKIADLVAAFDRTLNPVLNEDGTITLFHGTTKANADSILKDGDLGNAFWSSGVADEVGGVNGAGYYGDTIIAGDLDPRDVEFSLTGEFMGTGAKNLRVVSKEEAEAMIRGADDVKVEPTAEEAAMRSVDEMAQRETAAKGGEPVPPESAKTIRVYHGSDTPVRSFEEGRPMFFTDSKEYAVKYGEHVSAADIKLKNPVVIDAATHPMGPDAEELALDPKWVAEQVKAGHDGLIVKDGQVTDYVSFSPKNVEILKDNVVSAVDEVLPVAPRRKAMTPEEAAKEVPDDIAPGYKPSVNLVKKVAGTDDKFEVLQILAKEFPKLPERVKDVFVNKLASLKRTSDIEGVLKAAYRLNASGSFPASKLKGETKRVVDRTLPRSIAQVMTDSEKVAYVKSITDHVDSPEKAALAQSEYDRIMESADQRVIDHYNNLQMERDFLSDSLTYDEAGSLYKRYYARFRSRDAGDLAYALEDIMNTAQKKQRERIAWKRGMGARKPQLTKTEEAATRLDTEIEGLGFKDFDEAQAAVERYVKSLARVKEIDETLKEMKPLIRAAEILRPLLDDIPVVLSKKVNVIDDVINSATARSSFQDIGNVKIFSRDVYRNFRRFFGSYYDEIKKAVLDPFDDGKRAFVDEINGAGDRLKADVVDKFGFKRKSKESEWIQRLFDTDLPEGWRRTPDQAIDEFGEETYQKMVEADKWFRGQYRAFIQNVNEVRAQMYPNNPEKLVSEQKNYYRHFREMDTQFGDALRAFFDTPAGIDPKLVGLSEFTEPKSRFASFAQQRLGQETDLDAIGGFIDYMPMYAYSVHIDPHISTFRYLRRRLAEKSPVKGSKLPVLDEIGRPTGIEERVSGADNFLTFLNHFANDLAGKTNPADRLVQEAIPGGRATLRVVDWLNNRIKANQVLGNAGTGIAQLANLPLGLASTGPKHFSKGIVRTVGTIGREADKYREMSTFLPERYLQSLKDRFPVQFSGNKLEASIDGGRRALGWFLRTLDKVGTDTIWNAHLEEYLAKNMRRVDGQEIWSEGASPEAAVRFADSKTRDLVGGRGIGEVPVAQKAKMFQSFAPFTLEVENFWHVMDDWRRAYYKGADNRNLTAIATLLAANYIYNEFSERTRGSRVVFDPINALIDGIRISMEEVEDGDYAAAIYKPMGRLAGEYLSNKALGQFGAQAFVPSMYREGIFGEQDPTRFGIGFPIPATVGKVVTGIMEGDPKEVIKGLMNVALPYGAKGIEKAWEGVEAMLNEEVANAAGKKAFDVRSHFGNWVKSVLFGQYATSDARKYFEERNLLFRRLDRQEEERQENLALAEKEFAAIKKIKKEQGTEAAKAAFAALKERDKSLAERVKNVGEAEKKGLTGNDRLVKMLGVENGERAKYIVEEMRGLETAEERKAYLKDLKDKDLLTKEVRRQVKIIWTLKDDEG